AQQILRVEVQLPMPSEVVVLLQWVALLRRSKRLMQKELNYQLIMQQLLRNSDPIVSQSTARGIRRHTTTITLDELVEVEVDLQAQRDHIRIQTRVALLYMLDIFEAILCNPPAHEKFQEYAPLFQRTFGRCFLYDRARVFANSETTIRHTVNTSRRRNTCTTAETVITTRSVASSSGSGWSATSSRYTGSQ
ncbi:unnamed protein product, partial [Amoebophrya sp. A25]